MALALTPRLSVIISPPSILPLPTRRALTERSVESVLSQSDPIGTEVVLTTLNNEILKERTADHIEAVFSTAIAGGRLKVSRCDQQPWVGAMRNQGAAVAQGSYLAFLNTDDYWKPGRLAALEPQLKHHDLILASPQDGLTESSDWLAAFLSSNWALTSSAVIRRTLFEELGGFPERVAAGSEYEFWLRCMLKLLRAKQKDRFLMTQNEHVVVESPGDEMLPAPIKGLRNRFELIREALSLLHIAPSLPARYWPIMLRRLTGRGKGIWGK